MKEQNRRGAYFKGKDLADSRQNPELMKFKKSLLSVYFFKKQSITIQRSII